MLEIWFFSFFEWKIVYCLNFKRKTYLWECECVCMNFAIEPARFDFDFFISQKVLCFSTPNSLVQCTDRANAEASKSQKYGEFHDDFFLHLDYHKTDNNQIKSGFSLLNQLLFMWWNNCVYLIAWCYHD